LLAAIRVAASPEARGKGALVVMDERILSAPHGDKLFARGGGFDAGEMGLLGIVAAHGVDFFYSPVRRHTTTAEFELTGVTDLPAVDIRYSYAGGGGSDGDSKVSA